MAANMSYNEHLRVSLHRDRGGRSSRPGFLVGHDTAERQARTLHAVPLRSADTARQPARFTGTSAGPNSVLTQYRNQAYRSLSLLESAFSAVGASTLDPEGVLRAASRYLERH